MTPWIRRLHKWVGLIIALQFVIWVGSGLVMSLLDHERVEGHQHQAEHAHKPPAWPTGAIPPSQVLATARQPVQSLEAIRLLDQPVYRLADTETVWLFDAKTGRPVTIDASKASAIANAD